MTSRPRHPAVADAALYGASAAFAVMVTLGAAIPQFREWGRMAIAPYALGAVAAILLARRGAGIKPRATLAALVFVTAALAPMAAEAVWRFRTAPGLHAQSEVIVTEEAAKALVEGRNPYAAVYLTGPLAARPLPTKTHFPYVPGSLVFGLPRALDGDGPLTDARVWFGLSFVAAMALALRRSGLHVEGRIRIAQVSAVLPTGAVMLATGGHDLPPLGLMLLALVLIEGQPGWAGLVSGAAAAIKQTTWPLLPFLLLASPDRRRTAAGMAVIPAVAVMPFVLWDSGAFVEDVVKFPLGLGQGTSAAGTPTLGSLIARAPGGDALAVAVFVAVVGGVGAWLLWRRPWPGGAGVARAAGALWVAAVLFAPAARFGYLVYPINLLVWSVLLRAREREPEVSVPGISPPD